MFRVEHFLRISSASVSSSTRSSWADEGLHLFFCFVSFCLPLTLTHGRLLPYDSFQQIPIYLLLICETPEAGACFPVDWMGIRSTLAPRQGLASRNHSEFFFDLGSGFSFPVTGHRGPAVAGICPEGHSVPPLCSLPRAVTFPCDLLLFIEGKRDFSYFA